MAEGDRTCRRAAGHGSFYVGAVGFIAGMLRKGITNVLVHALCSFRVFIVPINVLGNDETQVNFGLCDIFPIRPDDAIVWVDKAAAVRGKVYRLKGRFPICIFTFRAWPIRYLCDSKEFMSCCNVVYETHLALVFLFKTRYSSICFFASVEIGFVVSASNTGVLRRSPERAIS